MDAEQIHRIIDEHTTTLQLKPGTNLNPQPVPPPAPATDAPPEKSPPPLTAEAGA